MWFLTFIEVILFWAKDESVVERTWYKYKGNRWNSILTSNYKGKGNRSNLFCVKDNGSKVQQYGALGFSSYVGVEMT